VRSRAARLREAEPVRRSLPVLVAIGLVAAVVIPYLALGGGSYKPKPVADPCVARERPSTDALGPTIEGIALQALDGVACKLGVSREALVLALRSEDAFDSFARKHGIERTEADQAVHDGLVQAVDNAANSGALPGLIAPIVRKAAESV